MTSTLQLCSTRWRQLLRCASADRERERESLVGPAIFPSAADAPPCSKVRPPLYITSALRRRRRYAIPNASGVVRSASSVLTRSGPFTAAAPFISAAARLTRLVGMQSAADRFIILARQRHTHTHTQFVSLLPCVHITTG